MRITRALLSEWKLSVGQRPAIVECIQKVTNQFPMEHLGKDDDGMMLCPMKVFTGLNPSAHLVRPSPLRRFRDLKDINEERAIQLVNIRSIYEALAGMHKNISTRKEHKRTQSQTMYNAKTNVLPVNFEVGDYVMIRTHAKRSHKFRPQWRGPMNVTDAKSHLIVDVENLNDGSKLDTQAQRMLPFPATRRGEQTSVELERQAKHYDTQHHLV